METIQKYRIGFLIASVGVIISVYGVFFTTSPLLSSVFATAGVFISLIGGALMVYYTEKYNKEIAQKNTDKVEEFVKDRTGIKIPPPPWLKKKP